tara:strand:+ start:146 stop:259 length:114 start_codon:yes stop_codon:yes gene_type:complete
VVVVVQQHWLLPQIAKVVMVDQAVVVVQQLVGQLSQD